MKEAANDNEKVKEAEIKEFPKPKAYYPGGIDDLHAWMWNPKDRSW